MKNTFVILFSLITLLSKAQIPTITNGIFIDTVITKAAMEAYSINSNVNNLIVSDTIFGGGCIFKLVNSVVLVPDSGTVFAAWGRGTNMFWVRQFDRSLGVRGEWFGMDPTNTNDNSFQLSSAIAFCLKNGALRLRFGCGLFKFTNPVWIGTGGNTGSGSTSGFIMEGIGTNSTGTSQAGGTCFTYEGANPDVHLFTFNPSVYRFFEMRNIAINCRNQNGAAILLNFNSSYFTRFRFSNCSFSGADTLVAIQDSAGSNGEFTYFDNCSFGSSSSYCFYQNSSQAFAPYFNHCRFTPEGGTTVFGINTQVGGTVLDCSVSFTTATSAPSIILQSNGGANTDVMNFIGGRWEGVDVLVQFLAAADQQKITFTGVTWSSNTRVDTIGTWKDSSFAAVDFSAATASNGRCEVNMKDCSAYLSLAYTLQQKWPINMVSSGLHCFRFRAENCRWINLYPNTISQQFNTNGFSVGSGQQYNGDYVEFSKCFREYISRTQIKQIDIIDNTVNNLTETNSFIRDNILLHSGFGSVVGSNIVAPSPWIHTGTGYFISLQNLNNISVNPRDITPFGKRMILDVSSGVYQNVLSVGSLPYSTWIQYNAMATITGSGEYDVELVNSISGAIYAQTQIYAFSIAQYRKNPIRLTAWVPANEPAGSYVQLILRNISTTNQLTVDIYWQGISQNFNNVFAPTGASTVEDSLSYSLYKESIRIFSDLVIPYISDSSKSLIAPPDSTGNLYLSQLDSALRIGDGGHWEEFPRQDRGYAPPALGYWPQNWIRWNNSNSVGSPIGWVCVTSGIPGSWQQLGLSGSGNYILANPASTQSAFISINGSITSGPIYAQSNAVNASNFISNRSGSGYGYFETDQQQTGNIKLIGLDTTNILGIGDDVNGVNFMIKGDSTGAVALPNTNGGIQRSLALLAEDTSNGGKIYKYWLPLSGTAGTLEQTLAVGDTIYNQQRVLIAKIQGGNDTLFYRDASNLIRESNSSLVFNDSLNQIFLNDSFITNKPIVIPLNDVIYGTNSSLQRVSMIGLSSAGIVTLETSAQTNSSLIVGTGLTLNTNNDGISAKKIQGGTTQVLNLNQNNYYTFGVGSTLAIEADSSGTLYLPNTVGDNGAGLVLLAIDSTKTNDPIVRYRGAGFINNNPITSSVQAASFYISGSSAINNLLTIEELKGVSGGSVSAGTGAGTGPTLAFQGSSIGGTLTVTTGTLPTASGNIITYVYPFPYATSSFVTLTPANAATALLSGTQAIYVTSGASSFTITAGTVGLGASTLYQWYYTANGY